MTADWIEQLGQLSDGGGAIANKERREAQSRLAPQLSYGRHFGPAPHHARNAAVLVALFRRGNQWLTTLTRRPAALKTHGGQVCFPGGVLDSGEDHWTAAQREWAEELGAHAPWRRLGTLGEIYVFASNHRIRPCLALTDPPEYEPNEAEVAAVLETPLAAFLDEGVLSQRTIHRWGARFDAPCYEWNGEQIWGATAVILAELALLLRKAEFPVEYG